MKKEDLLYEINGTETPLHLTKREEHIVNVCLRLINEREFVINTLKQYKP